MNKKYLYLLLLLILLIIVIAVVVVPLRLTKIQEQRNEPTSFLTIGNEKITLEIADTVDEQAIGLSGRESLPKDTALLFVFEESGQWGFWMKDMKFPIDMMWLDKNFKVVFIKQNATPESYPEVYINTTPALYVLETYSGFVKDHKVKVGDQLDFTLKN